MDPSAVHVESPPCWHSPGRMSWKMPSRGLFRQCTVAAPLASRALFGSQGGPGVGLPFSCAPTARRISSCDASAPASLATDRNCRCGLPLDPRGHEQLARQRLGTHLLGSIRQGLFERHGPWTWTWLDPTLSTIGDWRLLLTACHFFWERSWRSTRHSPPS